MTSTGSIPWQFKWKRPQWQSPEGSSRSSQQNVPSGAVQVTCASAEVLPDEVVRLGSNETRSADNPSWILVVTLFATTGKQNRRHSGDLLLLELLKQDESRLERIQSRVLRWPSSALIEQEEKEVEEEKQSSWTWGKQKKKAVPDHVQGLVSINLCRRSLLGDDAEPVAAVDAMDVLQLMSLGLVDDTEPAMQTPSSTHDSKTSDRQMPDVSPAELVLVCLSTDGRLHVYLPLSILSEGNSKPMGNGISEGLSSMFFGDSLYQEMQQSMLPLSQPVVSINLSVPLRKHSQAMEPIRAKKFKSQQNHGEIDELDANYDTEEEQIGRLSVWDSSFWDANVEPSTAVYRTLQNEPEIVAPAFGYVAVAGRGIRVRWKRNNRKSSRNPDANGASTKNEGDSDSGEEAGTTPGQDNETPQMNTPTEKEQKPAWIKYYEAGGFITFISLQHWAEVRTVYLPFAPKQVSPITWGDMCFVIVFGDEASAPMQAPIVMLIRVDSSNTVGALRGEAHSRLQSQESNLSGSSVLHAGASKLEKEKTTLSVKRFHPLPVVLDTGDPESSTTVISVAASSVFTSPPSVAVMFTTKTEKSIETVIAAKTLDCFDLVSYPVVQQSIGGYKPSFNPPEKAPAVMTRQNPGHIVQMPVQDNVEKLQKAACQLGQGWMLVGLSNAAYFVSFEGATVAEGACVVQLFSADTENSSLSPALTSILVPSHPVHVASCQYHQRDALGDQNIYKSTANLELPFTSPYELPHVLKQADMPTLEEDLEWGVDEIVGEALDSISSLRYDDLGSIKATRPRSYSLSHREKSERLLRHCTSWTMLDEKEGSKILLEGQVPVLTARLGSQLSVLSLRRIVVDNGVASPFNQVLAWLSQSEEYFTAASVALDLLRDADTLRDLRRAAGSDVYDNDRKTLEGLLDGIIPLYQEEPIAPSQSVLTQLADMTVGCLTRGGLAMSTTLENFVRRNESYDPSRACLMLVAAAAFCVSDDETSVKSIMGNAYDWPEEGPPIEDILWPLRCLLQLGISRDYLPTTLILINATIPDELRRRKRIGETTESVPSMELCKSLVKMIVSSSGDAAEMLLAFTDDESNERYWKSLDHETQLELTLISIDDAFPLLRQTEIRKWTLDLLGDGIQTGSSTKKEPEREIPVLFLKDLCCACFSNAGCDLEVLNNNGSSIEPENTSGKSIESPTFTVEESEVDGKQEHTEKQRKAREALSAAPGSGGLDFDLLVPALLLLQLRRIQWREDSSLSTQTLLDAACYLAGRHTMEEPIYSFDGATVMKQCAMAGNVSAGANLIGGRDGLVLKCCDILIHGASMSMDDAEAFILKEKFFMSNSVKRSRRGKDNTGAASFSLTEDHRHVLWLLDEHVLNVRTFGEFSSTHLRGKVDPVFAARACLRTWWRLSLEEPGATAWLIRWLRQRLGMSLDNISPKRLACAALVRALLWPTSESVEDIGEIDAKSDELLANAMVMESQFLVQLCQSCCGLVESIPSSLAEELLKQGIDSPGSGNLPPNRSLQVDV